MRQQDLNEFKKFADVGRRTSLRIFVKQSSKNSQYPEECIGLHFGVLICFSVVLAAFHAQISMRIDLTKYVVII